jgi:hypothetical protein
VNARKFQQLLQKAHPFIRHHITRLVMALAETSASHKDAVCPCLQSLQDIVGRYRPGTHHPNDSDRRRILHSTDPSQVSGSISSPCAQESNDLRLKIIRHEKLPSTPHSSPSRGERKGGGCYCSTILMPPGLSQSAYRSACW